MKILPGNAQHIGKRREQQDAFGFSDIDDPNFTNHGGVLAVLSDGMGGMEMGREAGLAAVAAVLTGYCKKPPDMPIPEALNQALIDANQAVYNLQRRDGRDTNAGATLCAAVIHENHLYWVSVGDSRIYRYRNGELSLLTQDHIYARELEKEAARGNISREEAENDPEKDALTSFLGERDIEAIGRNETPMPLFSGDRILLCSDGLYRALSEKRIARALSRHSDPQAAAETLITDALAQDIPHQDNVTAAILALAEEPSVSRKKSGYKLFFVVVFILILAGIGWMVYERLKETAPGTLEAVEITPQDKETVDDKHPEEEDDEWFGR